ncbi:MAG: hypothetical protein Q7K43_01445 [Candidatus Woesearchaeota archaeon]|nr:hypothetical protein [Candidatus Woesearchaeota archaeon]
MKRVTLLIILLALVACTQNTERPSPNTMLEQQTVVQSANKAQPNEPSDSKQPLFQPEQRIIPTQRTLAQEWSSGRCEGSGAVNLSSPINPEQLELIAPYGLMIDAHVTPIDHQYWSPKGEFMNAPPTQVLAPADGFVVSMQHMVQFVGDKDFESKVDDYRLVLEHSCTLYTYFIHIGKLSEKIMNEFNKQRRGALYANLRVPVKRGEILGFITKPVDFAVVDTTKELTGFIKPEHYNAEPWKINTVDPFDYFTEPVRSQLLSRNPRSTQPLGGKIDHDQQGFLIGNWFAIGTNGYGGLKQEEYWREHLAFAPDVYDLTQFVVSLGSFKGKAKQFGIKEGISPALVNTDSGIVKYSLAEYSYTANGKPWSHQKYEGPVKATITDSPVQATLLVQVTGTNSIKAEIFTKQPEEVTGFENPIEFER